MTPLNGMLNWEEWEWKSLAEYMAEYHKDELSKHKTEKQQKAFLKSKGVKLQPDDEGVMGVAVRSSKGKKMITGKEMSVIEQDHSEYGSTEVQGLV